MKKKASRLFLAMALAMSVGAIESYAKLPIEYSNFIIGGKKVRLPLAELVIDNEPINKKTSGVDPVTINSRTLVPVRALSEKLGYKVRWSEPLQRVTVENAGKKIELFIGNPVAKIDGKNVKITDSSKPLIISSSTYVPIRFVVENLGLDIDYNAKINKISLNSKKVAEKSSEKADDIGDTLFDDKVDVSSEKTETAKDETPSNAMIPKDVERFTISAPSKPKEPDKPTAPAAPTIAPVGSSNANDNSVITASNAKLKYDFENTDKEMFKITQENGKIDSNYFYLTNPNKLVIDIKGADIGKADEVDESLDGSVFKQLNALYHADGNYTRFVILLGDDITPENIKIEKTSNGISAQKISTVKTQSIVSRFDRNSGSVTIKTLKNVDLTNNSDDDRKISVSIPKSMITLNSGDFNISNRIVKSMKVVAQGDEYILDIQLADRVSYSISKSGSVTNTIIFKKQNRSTPLIVLDAGHGGKDPGAQRVKYSIDEKTLNIQVTRKLKQKLEDSGYTVVLTRSDDTFVPLNDIASISNGNDPDIFISIHHNSSDNTASNGIESFYHESQDSKKLADSIQKQLISKSGAVNRGTKSMPFVVIKKTTAPATLLELGFMTNDKEVVKNMSQSYQDTLADAIVQGVNDYFGR